MAFLPAAVVTAPVSRGLRYGLLTAANGPVDLPEHARAGGLIYEPVTCGHAHLYPVECGDERALTEKVFDPADPLTSAEPFVVYATYVCGPVGYTAAQLEGKARQRLANGEQTMVEEALAEVLAISATPIAAPDPADFRSVVGALEQWLYGLDGANYGNRGVLHVPARYASRASAHGALLAEGPTYRTVMGTTWSFGGGYDDNGSIYITGSTTVWRSPDVNVPPASQTFDRANNQYRLIAEREYAVAFDCVAAVASYTGDLPAS